jgi:hypothetical protein
MDDPLRRAIMAATAAAAVATSRTPTDHAVRDNDVMEEEAKTSQEAIRQIAEEILRRQDAEEEALRVQIIQEFQERQRILQD